MEHNGPTESNQVCPVLRTLRLEVFQLRNANHSQNFAITLLFE